jgi:hypothetical protein
MPGVTRFLYEVVVLERGPFSFVKITAVGIRCADHVTPLPTKVSTNFVDKRGRSVGIILLRTKSHRGLFLFCSYLVLVEEGLERERNRRKEEEIRKKALFGPLL